VNALWKAQTARNKSTPEGVERCRRQKHGFYVLPSSYYALENFLPLTGRLPSVYRHGGILPGVLEGIDWAEPGRIKAERSKWKWVTQALLNQPAARHDWGNTKRRIAATGYLDDEDQWYRTEINRIHLIRNNPHGAADPRSMKHIHPDLYYKNSIREWQQRRQKSSGTHTNG
jgi:hypothetical protein